MQQHSITTEAFGTAAPEDRLEYVALRFMLPYRLRLGIRHSATVQVGGSEARLWFRNAVAVPSGASMLDVLKSGAPSSRLLTEVLVWVPTAGKGDGRDWATGIEAVNYFVMGYAEAARVIFGATPLRLLAMMEVLTGAFWHVRVLAKRGESLDHLADQCFALASYQQPESLGRMTGELDDLPRAVMDEIPGAMARCQNHLFHQFAFEAKSKMLDEDSTGALLMAVAALEGAHSAFVQECLREKLPEVDHSLATDFIRELGMTLCNKLTPYLFMTADTRPSSDLIAEAGTALTYRNEIMHALRTKGGDYRHRLRTRDELNKAYSAALRLYVAYRDAYYAKAGPEGAPSAV